MKYNDINYRFSNQYFIVYFNNLTNQQFEYAASRLTNVPYCTGYIDFTYSSFLKTLISTCIHQQCFIYDDAIAVQKDECENEVINNTIFDFYKTNKRLIGIDYLQYNSFLCYKIKRSKNSYDRNDQMFSVNAISPINPVLSEYKIDVSTEKFSYLLSNKTGSLRSSGAAELSKEEFESQIYNNINTNYIFSLCFNEHRCLKFNTDIELYNANLDRMQRYIASFEIVTKNKTLRLITYY